MDIESVRAEKSLYIFILCVRVHKVVIRNREYIKWR